jgi:3-oxoacyl-[acyl-carrier-protein] synthase II
MKRELDRRVVITGTGTINPVGTGTEATWQGLVSGQSGIGPITLFDTSAHPVRIAGEVKGFDANAVFGKRRARHLDRFTQLALVAAREAIEASKLNLESIDRTRVGVNYASGVGGIGTTEQGTRVMLDRGPEWLSPYMCPMMLPNMAAGEVAMEFGLQGPSSCTVTACAASAMAIGDGYDQIRLGRADVMLCGGSEAGLTPLGLAGFSAMKALSARNDAPTAASRPFDRGRDGFVAAEGAATIVLEDRDFALRRGAPILAELVGFGTTCDAHHVTAPHPEGDGAIRAMRMALSEADLQPSDIGYINAHGTSTPPNDRIETLAVKKVFGSGVPVSSTKSMTGHMLGAAGALEAMVCVKTLQTGILPPTINYDDPDPDCDLDYVPNAARNASVHVAMSNSFGFGGHNACLIFKRP